MASGRRGHRPGHDGAPEPPYSRNGRKERFQVLLAAEDLEAYTHMRCRDKAERGERAKSKARWPARERGPLGLPSRMSGEATEAYCLMAEANDLDLRIPREREERLALQRKALTRLKLLNHHIEYSYACHWISDGVFDYWTSLVDSCRYQAAAWRTSDKERAARFEAQERDLDLRRLARAVDDLRRGHKEAEG